MNQQEAEMQADSLCLYTNLPRPLAHVVWRTVANPAAGPDTLLILADALRDSDDSLAPSIAHLMNRHRVANAIAALAPSRATPLEI